MWNGLLDISHDAPIAIRWPGPGHDLPVAVQELNSYTTQGICEGYGPWTIGDIHRLERTTRILLYPDLMVAFDVDTAAAVAQRGLRYRR